ncbi:MAG: divergent PAP2 family protein [Spirochaetaceae bacterium]|jgi:acid phosphatase family membrane protein YuiD|nr:divergent PAP2 family protein [Spirochaetaceae bacterium]
MSPAENHSMFVSFFQNPLFLSGITSFLFAQFIKFAIIITKRVKKSRAEMLEAFLWRTGGMPSSHASTITAVTVTIGIEEGINSNLFILSLFLSLIILRDALGVRHSSGMQARTLNALGGILSKRFQVEYHPVKEILGHKPLEVVVGCFIGFFIAAAYAYL